MKEQLNLIREVANGTYLDCYDEIETSLKRIAKQKKIKVYYSKRSRLKSLLLKMLSTFKFTKAFFLNKEKTVSLSLLMGDGYSVLLPHLLKHQSNFVYMYDAWPRFHKHIQEQAELLNVKAIFFSSKAVTEKFNLRNSTVQAYWVPEGIDLLDYQFVTPALKDIDVLEFGRKYLAYHQKIVEPLRKATYSHLYEKVKGKVIFETRTEFLSALSKAKISICIPSNITHPERSEGISSMTLRYLQSMASKCLILGVMPDEMRLLFDYEPIIEINFNAPEKQILEILNNYQHYLPLIEKNYNVVKKSHLWDNRLADIITIIENYER